MLLLLLPELLQHWLKDNTLPDEMAHHPQIRQINTIKAVPPAPHSQTPWLKSSTITQQALGYPPWRGGRRLVPRSGWHQFYGSSSSSSSACAPSIELNPLPPATHSVGHADRPPPPPLFPKRSRWSLGCLWHIIIFVITAIICAQTWLKLSKT